MMLFHLFHSPEQFEAVCLMCVCVCSPVRVLSKDSPSGDMKAVVRQCTIKGEDKQFLEVGVCLGQNPKSQRHLPKLPNIRVLHVH